MSIFSGGDQTQNIDVGKNLVNKFLNKASTRVASMASTVNDIEANDIYAIGKGSEVNFKQVANITSKQYVNALNTSVQDVKSTMLSEIEASAQNDKSAGGGFGEAIGPWGAGAHASGLFTQADTTQNISNSMDLVNNVVKAVERSTSQEDKLLNKIGVGNVYAEKGGKVNFTQQGAIAQLQDIVLKDNDVQSAENEMRSKLKASETMTNSYNRMMMIVGVVVVFFMLSGIMKGSDTPCSQGMTGVECENRKTSRHNWVVFGYFILLVLLCVVVWFLWTKMKSGWKKLTSWIP